MDKEKHVHNQSPPPPLLLTFQTLPTYTVGRRHLKANPISQTQIDFLTSRNSIPARSDHRLETGTANVRQPATFYASPRGGLLTYHGPGQLTAYLIYNLRYHGITPRCHIRLLENAVINTCARHGVPNVMTTADPGVWIGDPVANGTTTSLPQNDQCCSGQPSYEDRVGLNPTDRKVCAIGVHVSRGITSHGLGLNVVDAAMPPDQAQQCMLTTRSLSQTSNRCGDSSENAHTRTVSANPRSPATNIPAPGYLSWGFGRIIACGLEGKQVTWLSKEQKRQDASSPSIKGVAETLAKELAQGLSTQGRIKIDQVQQLPHVEYAP